MGNLLIPQKLELTVSPSWETEASPKQMKAHLLILKQEEKKDSPHGNLTNIKRHKSQGEIILYFTLFSEGRLKMGIIARSICRVPR